MISSSEPSILSEVRSDWILAVYAAWVGIISVNSSARSTFEDSTSSTRSAQYTSLVGPGVSIFCTWDE